MATIQPPAKRMRFSPEATPYSPVGGTPNPGYLSLPTTPVQGSATLPQNSNSSNQPQPIHVPMIDTAQRPPPGSMPPPERPAERAGKPQDDRDLNDAVAASGINLRDEEDFASRYFFNSLDQTNGVNTSFTSQTSGSNTISPNTSFNQWSQSVRSSPAFQGSGVVSQPAVSRESVEDEITKKHQEAARALREHQENHIRNSFLLLNPVKHKLRREAYKQGTRINTEGSWDKDRVPPIPNQTQAFSASTPDGGSLVVAKAPALIERDAPLADILTLLSLAAQDRLRGLLEDTYTYTRSRQIGSNGIIPADFKDIALTEGKTTSATAAPVSITGTAWDATRESTVSPKTDTINRTQYLAKLLRKDSVLILSAIGTHPETGRLPTPPEESPAKPQETVRITENAQINVIRKRKLGDRKEEEARLAARNKRRQISTSVDTANGTSNVPAPAPEALMPKLTKKDREKAAKAGQSDEVAHRATNATASMALGGFGKSKKYSWLTGGGGGGGGASSGTSTPRPVAGSGVSGTSTPIAKPVEDGLRAKEKDVGKWREDGRGGKGLQLRDLVAALELDGRESKVLSKAYMKLKDDEHPVRS
jgi:hypothetical protein